MSEAAQSDLPILQVENLSVSYTTPYGTFRAVNEVSFQVRKGEILGIVGESGCGKSTAAFAIVNFLGKNGCISGGSICFQGRELVGLSQKELRGIRGNRISMVYQDPMQALNPVLRIGDQLTEVLTFHQDISKDQARAQSVDMLQKVYMPDARIMMNRYPHQLSGGQQQRVVIAMAMLNRPLLLIMDEPTTALDVTVEAVVLDLVRELKDEFDTGILYITHDLGVIARVSDHLNVMYAGEIVEQGSVRDVFRQSSHPYTQGLLRSIPRMGHSRRGVELYTIEGRVPAPAEKPDNECIFAPRCALGREECRQQHFGLTEISPDHSVRCWYAETKGQVPEIAVPEEDAQPVVAAEDVSEAVKPILQTKNLKIYYEQTSRSALSLLGLAKKQYIKAVDDIALQVLEGKTLGVVGESGCGKSTLAKGIIGLEKVTDGEISYLSMNISTPLDRRSLDLIKQLQMVFQNPDSTLNPSFTVGQQISRPLKRFKTVPRRQVRSNVENLLHSVRLDKAYYHRYPRQLSGGEKQRVAIARAIASHPEMLICDEPVSALDVSVQAAVLNLLNEIQAQTHCAMIFISHDLSVVRYFAEYIAVMYLGQIVEYGTTASIFSPPNHPYTEALLSAVPIPDPEATQKPIRLHGEVPSSLNPPSGCRFHTRCPRRSLLPDSGVVCEHETPPLRGSAIGHHLLCHLSLQELARIQDSQ